VRTSALPVSTNQVGKGYPATHWIFSKFKRQTQNIKRSFAVFEQQPKFDHQSTRFFMTPDIKAKQVTHFIRRVTTLVVRFSWLILTQPD
jgi:hypothetical protein